MFSEERLVLAVVKFSFLDKSFVEGSEDGLDSEGGGWEDLKGRR